MKEMRRAMKARRGLMARAVPSFLVLAVFLWIPVDRALGQKVPGATQGPSVAPSFIIANQNDYAGIDRCRSCHKPEYREYEKTAHSKVTVPGKNYISGCEVCHGPGKAHADAIEAAEGDEGKTQRALNEHPIFSFSVNQKDFFEHSTHVAHGLSCDQCHTSHLVSEVKDQSKGPLYSPQAHFYQVPEIPDEVRWLHSSLLKESEPKLCFGCHATVEAEFALPVHHRVPEGLVKCTDCHTPHGSLNRVSLTRPNFQSCLNCHQEKRGPYVYEHASVKVEGCATCHTPHGSTNRMLLVRREGRQLCLQCHINAPGRPGVPHSRFGFQTSGECTRCHVAIHGSNFDPNFLR